MRGSGIYHNAPCTCYYVMCSKCQKRPLTTWFTPSLSKCCGVTCNICRKLLKTGFFSVHKVIDSFYTQWLTLLVCLSLALINIVQLSMGFFFTQTGLFTDHSHDFLQALPKTTLRLTAWNLRNYAVNGFSNQNKPNQPIINHLFAYVFVVFFLI